MQYVIVDLEATCWQTKTSIAEKEIIEIGAVLLDGNTWDVEKEFSCFVKPVENPLLSEFCTQLTTIKQHDIDHAQFFPVVLESFLEWIGTEGFTFCSWGIYDLNQLKADCERHSLIFPQALNNHVNLKQAFATIRGVKSCGVTAALKQVDLTVDGTLHRGIDDARNITKLARIILPEYH